MAYTIYNNDGTVLSTIAVGDVDTYSTSLDLIGKNVNNYGEYYNTNLVKLLTSFASPKTEQPRSPQPGQLWYNTTIKQLCVYDTVGGFKVIGGATVSGTPPASSTTGTTGTIWFDTINSQLKIWDGDNYNLVGPSTSGLLGTFGILPPPGPIRNGESPNPVNVSLINSYGLYAGLIAEDQFNMTASSSTIYLAGTQFAGQTKSIVKGVTVFQNLEVLGDIYVTSKLKINSNQIEGTRTDLTAYYNITPYGTYTATTTASTFATVGDDNEQAYIEANRAIAADLVKMFSTTTYVTGSQASVVCVYNTTTSVRKFELKSLIPPRVWWEPLDSYAYSWTATFTTTNLSSVPWLWDISTSTNIVP